MWNSPAFLSHLHRQRLLSQPELLTPYLVRKQAVVVTNATIAPLYLDVFAVDAAKGNFRLAGDLPDGRSTRPGETLNLIFDALIGGHCERNTTLIALGGGVIRDMGGFTAACYQRGMPFIQIRRRKLPGRLVGRRQDCNQPPAGKNMIGALYQPKMVLARYFDARHPA